MKIDIDVYFLKHSKKEKFKRADLVLERSAEIGYVEIYPIECTRWNYHEDGRDAELPREDGSFDVEGHSSSDVQAVWNIRWWEPRHWHTIGTSIKQYLEGVKEFVIDDFRFWIRKEPKYLLKKMRDWLFVNPLKVEQEGWVWVADSLSSSMKTAAYDLADDLFAQEEGFEDSLDRFTRKRKIFDPKKVQARADELMSTGQGRADVFIYMVGKDKLVKVSDHMWVSEDDPTCFVVDDEFIKFDLKNGWSPEMLARVIAYWYRVFYGVDLMVKIKENR